MCVCAAGLIVGVSATAVILFIIIFISLSIAAISCHCYRKRKVESSTDQSPLQIPPREASWDRQPAPLPNPSSSHHPPFINSTHPWQHQQAPPPDPSLPHPPPPPYPNSTHQQEAEPFYSEPYIYPTHRQHVQYHPQPREQSSYSDWQESYNLSYSYITPPLPPRDKRPPAVPPRPKGVPRY